MKILYLDAHSILTFDEMHIFHALGHDVVNIGGYIDPAHPHDPKRPALPQIPFHPELKQVVDDLATPDNLSAAKEHLPQALIDWADTIIFAAYEWRWLAPQWDRIRDKRVIWRTIGQSLEPIERLMAPLFRDGLEIVRYSPKERNLPSYAGESAVIRFGKDPADWYGWTGEDEVVTNVTQHLAQRDPHTNYGFWRDATSGLPARPMGPGSERIGGLGEVGYDFMRETLRTSRAYCYTGTQPASYTLGLIEAMLTGIPVVSIGPGHMEHPDLFEGHEIAGVWTDDPLDAHRRLRALLESPHGARAMGQTQRERAIDLFGFEGRMAEWAEVLG